MPATYTAPEIVSRLSPLARDLARVGVLPLAKLHWTTHDRFHGLRR